MEYTLADGDRADILEIFRGGASWSALNVNREHLRGWRVIRDTPRELVLGHGTGAALRLSRKGDQVSDPELLEGDDGRKVQAAHGFRPADSVKKKARDAFRPGRDLDEALDAFLPKRVRKMLPTDAPEVVRVSHGWDGLVDVDVRDGKVDGHRWVVGEAALDAYDAYDDAKVWNVSPWPKNPVPARTMDEVQLYCAVNKADVDRLRWRRQLEVRARMPEGWFRFEFDVADPSGEGLGEGRSKCLDPADYVLFGRNVLKALPESPDKTTPERRAVHAERMRLAIAALREALTYIPAGEDTVPLRVYHSVVNEFSRMRTPEKYSRAAIEAQIHVVEVAREAWVALSEDG